MPPPQPPHLATVGIYAHTLPRLKDWLLSIIIALSTTLSRNLALRLIHDCTMLAVPGAANSLRSGTFLSNICIYPSLEIRVWASDCCTTQPPPMTLSCPLGGLTPKARPAGPRDLGRKSLLAQPPGLIAHPHLSGTLSPHFYDPPHVPSIPALSPPPPSFGGSSFGVKGVTRCS